MKKDELLSKLTKDSTIKDTATEFIKLFLSEFEKKSLSKSKIKDFIGKENNPYYHPGLGPIINSSSLVRSLDSSLGNQVAILADVIIDKFGSMKRLTETKHFENSDKEIYQITGKLTNAVVQYIHESCSGKVINLDEEKFKELALDESQGFVIKSHESDTILLDEVNKEIAVMECKLGGNLDVKNKRANAESLLIQKALLIQNYPEYKVNHYLATQYNQDSLDGIDLKNQTVSLFGANNCLIGRQYWEFLVKGTSYEQSIWNDLKEGLATSSVSNSYGEDLLRKIQEEINKIQKS